MSDSADVDDATLYVLASKRLGREFARRGDSIEKVMAVLSEGEVRGLGDFQQAKKEIQTLLDLGLKQNVREMADKWRDSRRIRP